MGKIKRMHKIGDSKCVIIPSSFIKLMGLKEEIEFDFDGKNIIIKKPEESKGEK